MEEVVTSKKKNYFCVLYFRIEIEQDCVDFFLLSSLLLSLLSISPFLFPLSIEIPFYGQPYHMSEITVPTLYNLRLEEVKA